MCVYCVFLLPRTTNKIAQPCQAPPQLAANYFNLAIDKITKVWYTMVMRETKETTMKTLPNMWVLWSYLMMYQTTGMEFPNGN